MGFQSLRRFDLRLFINRKKNRRVKIEDDARWSRWISLKKVDRWTPWALVVQEERNENKTRGEKNELIERVRKKKSEVSLRRWYRARKRQETGSGTRRYSDLNRSLARLDLLSGDRFVPVEISRRHLEQPAARTGKIYGGRSITVRKGVSTGRTMHFNGEQAGWIAVLRHQKIQRSVFPLVETDSSPTEPSSFLRSKQFSPIFLPVLDDMRAVSNRNSIRE